MNPVLGHIKEVSDSAESDRQAMRSKHAHMLSTTDISLFDTRCDPCYNRTIMRTETTVELASYRLPLVVERVNGAYQATSPALDGFLVLADSLEEVLALAPGAARALLEAM